MCVWLCFGWLVVVVGLVFYSGIVGIIAVVIASVTNAVIIMAVLLWLAIMIQIMAAAASIGISI